MQSQNLQPLIVSQNPETRQRAHLVRDALQYGPSEAARQHGVSRQTAAKWLARYRQAGPEALESSSAPTPLNADLPARILRAPLWMPNTKWSTRSIAEALGVTQSRVARTWEPFRQPSNLTRALANHGVGRVFSILGMAVSKVGAILVLESAPEATDATPAVPPSPTTLRSLRTMLVTALVDSSGHDPEVVQTFWAEVSETTSDDATIVAVVYGDVSVHHSVSCTYRSQDINEWLSLFSFFQNSRLTDQREALEGLAHAARKWARAPEATFTWTAQTPPPDFGYPRSTRALGIHHSPDRVLADAIVIAIREDIRRGHLGPTDEVTESYLARRLHTTRSQVHAAMIALEAEGLFTLTSGRAAIIPIPTSNDIVEVYTARRALGGIAIHAAARWSPEARQKVFEALEILQDCAEHNDVWRSGEADLTFQNALAEASGLHRVTTMLHILADHLRIFIAVLGLGFTYPVQDAFEDSQAIFQALDAGHSDQAVRLWHQKMTDVMAYMVKRFRIVHPSEGTKPAGRSAPR